MLLSIVTFDISSLQHILLIGDGAYGAFKLYWQLSELLRTNCL